MIKKMKERIVQRIRKRKGITLIALIITVIVMLILAGVSISALMGGEGLFGRTSQVAKEYKIGEMLEVVETAKAYLFMDNVMDDKDINISNLIDKIKEISDINDKDYTITVNEEEQTARIVDKKTGAAVDIAIDEEGNITAKGNSQVSGSGGDSSSSDNNTITASEIEIESLEKNPTNKPVNVKIKYDVNVKIGNVALTNENRFQYRIGTGVWETAETAEITVPVNVNGTVYARYYDGKEGYKAVKIEINNIDTRVPEAFDLTVSATTNTITVEGTTVDYGIEGTAEENIGVRGYQYKLSNSDGTLVKDWTTETVETSHTFDEGIGAGQTYKVSMRAIDKAGNITEATNKEKEIKIENTVASITDLAKNGTLKVGDYIDYDAGVWTEADLEKITKSVGNPTLHSTVNDATNDNQVLPTVKREFGGFELGQSKNSNSTPNSTSMKPRTSGWRIWDIDDNGNVTIIHAGHPEMYCHKSDNTSTKILRNRDCSMYENDYAVAGKAHFLMGWEAAEWYNKQFETEYTLESWNEDYNNNGEEGERTFYIVIFSKSDPIEVLENGSNYCFASAYGTSSLFRVDPSRRMLSYTVDDSVGVRPLVSLKSDFKLELDTNKTEDGWNLWKIVEN